MDKFFEKYPMAKLEEHALETIESKLEEVQKLCKKNKDYSEPWMELKEMIHDFETMSQ